MIRCGRASRVALLLLATVGGLLTESCAQAGQTVRLPAALCRDGSLFADGVESGPLYSPDATPGAALVNPGNQQRQVLVGSNLRTYYLRVPPLYRADRPLPVLILLHGATGSSSTTPAAAQDLRDLFSASADRAGVLLVAPPASGASGGWEPSADLPFIEAILDDLEMAVVLDRQRRSLWGFSAGGHVAHGLALWNSEVFAAYAVKAGVLQAYAGVTRRRSRRVRCPCTAGLAPAIPCCRSRKTTCCVSSTRDGRLMTPCSTAKSAEGTVTARPMPTRPCLGCVAGPWCRSGRQARVRHGGRFVLRPIGHRHPHRWRASMQCR